jgi:hypothetical protein
MSTYPFGAETCCTISRPIRSAMHEPLRRKDAVWLAERPLLSATCFSGPAERTYT